MDPLRAEVSELKILGAQTLERLGEAGVAHIQTAAKQMGCAERGCSRWLGSATGMLTESVGAHEF